MELIPPPRKDQPKMVTRWLG